MPGRPCATRTADFKSCLEESFPPSGDPCRREQAEEALRESEERFRLAAQATNDVLYDWHIPSGTVTWGPSAPALFLAEEAGVSIDWWWADIHPEDVERVRSSLEAALGGDAASWSSGYRLRRGDGTFADLLDRGFIVRHEGKPTRMVGSMADVTQLNRLQAQLVQADRLAGLGLSSRRSRAGPSPSRPTGRSARRRREARSAKRRRARDASPTSSGASRP